MCGIFGVFGHEKAMEYTYSGLFALQHRGHEGAGIAWEENQKLSSEKGLGWVKTVFGEQFLKANHAANAIGHTRYSTAGSKGRIQEVQPFSDSEGKIAIAHNGNLTNIGQIKKEKLKGVIFQSTSDTEVILQLIGQSEKEGLIDKVVDALSQVEGSYSLLILIPGMLIAIRDPRGFRPLVLGELEGKWVFTSETCALDAISAKYKREVEPGEILVITKNKVESIFPFPKEKEARCIFEHIYFSRPDSRVFGECVNEIQRKLGAQLAKESDIEVDLITSIPDSGREATEGYAEISQNPLKNALIRNHYLGTGRTFIDLKHRVKEKFNVLRNKVEGKRVLTVDDSIVRGSTTRDLGRMFREAGAIEVHVRSASPPIKHPCFYGIDTSTREELIASSRSVEEIRDFIEADSLVYLSLTGLRACVKEPEKYCYACFTGEYPVLLKE